MRKALLILLICSVAPAEERFAINSHGRILGLISNGNKLGVKSGLFAVLPTGKRVLLHGRQPGVFTLPDTSTGRYQWTAEQDASGVRYSADVTAERYLAVDALELVLDLPREIFVNGRMRVQGVAEVALPATKPPGNAVYQGRTSSVRVADATGEWTLDLAFDNPLPLAVVDQWDEAGRSYQLRAVMAKGPIADGTTATIGVKLGLQANGKAARASVPLTLDAARVRFHFDGFGGNYCFGNDSPITTYMLENLKSAWTRFELKALAWDKERDHPGPEIRADLETMRRVQREGAKSVISIWILPERLYTSPYEVSPREYFRRIDPAKWDEVLDLVGSYLIYAKREYGVEPDLFSFNESNLGVRVGFTPEGHRDQIKRFGAYFRKLGLKTKMLLGDVSNPRDTHKWALAAAADPEAVQYLGAVAFHSWDGGSPKNYADWGDLAAWLQLPLLVAEVGVDPLWPDGKSWDYGLREAEMMQELLLYARPQGTQYWEFNRDHGHVLARLTPEGKVEPFRRFWLMKHFNNLTPENSDALWTSSGDSQVLFTAFRRQSSYALHIVNLGPAREAAITGLPGTDWRVTQSTESKQFENLPVIRTKGGRSRVALPARGMLTLTCDTGEASGVGR